jgi:hypothetical protein
MEALNIANLLADPAPPRQSGPPAGRSSAARPAVAVDPLDQALPWMVRHLGVGDALAAVLADDDAPAPEGSAQLFRALALIGYDARLVRRTVEEVADGPLPALLLLRGGDACVLTSCRRSRGQRLLNVVMPGYPPIAFDVPADDVANECTGMALLLRPVSAAVPPAPGADAARGPLARLAAALQMALVPAPLPPSQGPLTAMWARLSPPLAARLADWRASVAAGARRASDLWRR